MEHRISVVTSDDQEGIVKSASALSCRTPWPLPYMIPKFV